MKLIRAGGGVGLQQLVVAKDRDHVRGDRLVRIASVTIVEHEPCVVWVVLLQSGPLSFMVP